MNDDMDGGEDDEDRTPELLILEQMSGDRSDGGAATALIDVGAAGSSAV